MGFFLASREIWRNRTRYLSVSLFIALIALLVFFVGALAAGLSNANREFFDKLDAEVLVFQENVDLLTTSSRIELSKLRKIQRIEGVQNIGALGFGNGTIEFEDALLDELDVSIIGVELRKPGVPPLLEGSGLRSKQRKEAIIDKNVAGFYNLTIGDELTLKTIQGTEEEFFELKIVGITDSREYLYAPSIFVPLQVWEEIRPQANPDPNRIVTVANVAAIQFEPGVDVREMAGLIELQIDEVELADLETSIRAIPGYSAQQSTLGLTNGFTFLIGVLVIGGFFQIQTLQKIPQIGVLKAIGTPTRDVSAAVIIQIVLVNAIGVLFGTVVALGLGAALPPDIPAIFNLNTISVYMIILLAIGPLGGLISVRSASKVEPLLALGLSN